MVETLVNAAHNGDLAAVKKLIAAGANVNARNANGERPLHSASRKGHEVIAAKLIAAGAHVNAADVNGETPLHMASRKGYEGIVAKLIAAGANINAKDDDGWRPLHWGSHEGREVIVAKLIAAGANVNARNDVGETPLHLASREGHEGIVAPLIASGAHIGRDKWSIIQRNHDIKAVVSEQLSRRLARDIAKAPGDIKAIVIDDDGNLTPNGFDYAYAGLLPEVFKPAHWEGREYDGLEFYETLVKAIPDDLQDDVVPALDLTGLRRGAAKVKDESSAVERYVRPQGRSPKGVP